MIIGSVLENREIEKRISITPEIAKKYISLGCEVMLPENYANHLGIKDSDYREIGVKISKDENDILNKADTIVQFFEGKMDTGDHIDIAANTMLRTAGEFYLQNFDVEMTSPEIRTISASLMEVYDS